MSDWVLPRPNVGDRVYWRLYQEPESVGSFLRVNEDRRFVLRRDQDAREVLVDPDLVTRLQRMSDAGGELTPHVIKNLTPGLQQLLVRAASRTDQCGSVLRFDPPHPALSIRRMVSLVRRELVTLTIGDRFGNREVLSGELTSLGWMVARRLIAMGVTDTRNLESLPQHSGFRQVS